MRLLRKLLGIWWDNVTFFVPLPQIERMGDFYMLFFYLKKDDIEPNKIQFLPTIYVYEMCQNINEWSKRNLNEHR